MLAAVAFATAVAGAVQDHTGIPFGDMWDGYVGFFHRLSDGETSVWWSPHNEHRIVLARVVFWIDLAFFGGHGVFLVVANLALATIVAAVFAALFLERTADVTQRSDRAAFATIIVAVLFAGAQWENFRWGFQSCFFLAQLLPLAAFLTLQESADRVPGTGHFVAASALGLLSAGTMANGMLALPLMALSARLTGMRASRVVVLVALSAVVAIPVLHDASMVARHGATGLLQTFPGVVAYVLTYLGGPFAWLAGYRFDPVLVALPAGGVFVGLAAVALRRGIRGPRDRLAIALGVFIVFVVATAIVTAVGRLALGLEQAVASRYSTPVLMAWCALFVLDGRGLLELRRCRRTSTTLLLVSFVGVMVVRHVKDLPYDLISPSAQRLAALTLVLGIHDDRALATSALQPASARRESRWLESRRLAYFADPVFDDLRARIGTVVPATVDPRCPGRIASVASIPGESRYVRVAGAFVPRRSWRSAPFFVLIDRDRRVVGVAAWTFNPPFWDLDAGEAQRAARTPTDAFTGYVLADADLASLAMRGIDDRCETGLLQVPAMSRRLR